MSRQAFSKAIRSGRIKLVRGKIDTARADAQWRANTDPAPEFGVKEVDEGPKTKEGLPQSSLSYTTSRAIREACIARLARLEYEQKVGELISADKVRLQAFSTARRARDLLLAIPDRVAPIVAGLSDQLECHRILLQEIHRVCDELSNAAPEIEVYESAFAEGWAAEPILTVSEWADAHRMLSSKASSEVGPWRTDRTPYLREIMPA